MAAGGWDFLDSLLFDPAMILLQVLAVGMEQRREEEANWKIAFSQALYILLRCEVDQREHPLPLDALHEESEVSPGSL
jgi:hypothetical protein